MMPRMCDLGEKLVVEIFKRVPITSLKAVRSTCKTWEAITKSWVVLAAGVEPLPVSIKEEKSFKASDIYAIGYSEDKNKKRDHKILRLVDDNCVAGPVKGVFRCEIYEMSSSDSSWRVLEDRCASARGVCQRVDDIEPDADGSIPVDGLSTYFGGSFFVDEENKVAVVFERDSYISISAPPDPSQHTAFVFGQAGYIQSVNLGQALKLQHLSPYSGKHCQALLPPLVCSSSFRPTLVQVNQLRDKSY
ncbi:hypothetical protein Bca52824_084957 [Brassica carinata]|uniref:F-box domain-containing protein n=1 Tax=Brassica carinata TaxID=52824 RepID=A0A8X7TV96_BRACI|nr:hypothetical protein Bca52824_084957 [Brassica carinata]